MGRSERGTSVEQVGNCSHQLCRSKWLDEKKAVGHAIYGPSIGATAGHVDNGEGWIERSGVFCHFPAVHAAAQVDIDHECAVSAIGAL